MRFKVGGIIIGVQQESGIRIGKSYVVKKHDNDMTPTIIVTTCGEMAFEKRFKLAEESIINKVLEKYS